MPQPDFNVRQLSSSDTQELRRLNQLFADVFDDAESFVRHPPKDEYLQKLLGNHSIFVLASFAGEEIIGGLVAYELMKFEQERSEIYIYDLAVAEAHRRKGVATTLIEHLRDIASQRGAWVIYVQADYGDDPAVALYEKLGIREDVMHFDIAAKPLR
ncbi:MAG TPA: AAC(3)-I family aminoglycoside N-acetyltransferase [Steroidobacteraceae bacterium]|nr:AAC(3)-I family aminoglycoside N-acetyltransferase [Steroidobacteraceae bacterium]